MPTMASRPVEPLRAGFLRFPVTRRAPFAARCDMVTEIRVPTLGESISEATVGKWFKQRGDAVKADEPLVELETDKVTLEVNAPAAGVLSEIAAETGETVAIGALLGALGGAAARAAARRAAKAAASRLAAPPRPPARDRDAAGAVGGQARRRERRSTSPPSPAAASAARC